jgi:hypothetical protein
MAHGGQASPGFEGIGSFPMQRAIVSFEQDEELHWRAVLACGHRQHVRHLPPLVSRPWVLTEEGRKSMVGRRLDCIQCDQDDAGPQLPTGSAP